MALNLLLKEIKDPYIRENFKRLLKEVNSLEESGSVTNITNIVNNIFNSTAVWTKFNNVINASSSKAVDTISLVDFNTVKYIVTLYNTAQNKTRYFEMIVTNEGGTIKDTVFARSGSALNFSVNATVNSGDMELTVFNNELFNLDVNIGRLVQ